MSDEAHYARRIPQSVGERVRLTHAIDRMRTSLDSLELFVKRFDNQPLGQETAQSMMSTAWEIASSIVKHDAAIAFEEWMRKR